MFKKIVILITIALTLIGCEKVAEEVCDDVYTPPTLETAIDRAYNNDGIEMITFTEYTDTIEVRSIIYDNNLPDRVLIVVPAQTVATINLSLRCVDYETVTVSKDASYIISFMASCNIGTETGVCVTTDVLIDDTLDCACADDFVALYINGVKKCYWYLNRFIVNI